MMMTGCSHSRSGMNLRIASNSTWPRNFSVRTIISKSSFGIAAASHYGDKRANWELVGYVTAHGIAERKIERDEENKADLVGLQIAAQAGYHADFAIQLTHAMRNQHKDQSKFMAFFSDHPRWETREERISKNYDVALNAFSARWPVFAQSPGGVPSQITAYQAGTAPAPTPEPRGRAGPSNGATAALSSSPPVVTPANGLVNVTFTSSPPSAPCLV